MRKKITYHKITQKNRKKNKIQRKKRRNENKEKSKPKRLQITRDRPNPIWHEENREILLQLYWVILFVIHFRFIALNINSLSSLFMLPFEIENANNKSFWMLVGNFVVVVLFCVFYEEI